MSIATQINRIKANISAAYNSIASKGGAIPTERNSAGLASAIESIPISSGSSGSSSDEEKDILFFDYDGTIVESWSTSDLQTKTTLPPTPTHEGLISQGWNWNLAEIQNYKNEYPLGCVNVGSMFITDDGKTRIFIDVHIEAARELSFKVVFQNNNTIGAGISVDWGDGSESIVVKTNNSIITHVYDLNVNTIMVVTPLEDKVRFTLNSNDASNKGRAVRQIYVGEKVYTPIKNQYLRYMTTPSYSSLNNAYAPLKGLPNLLYYTMPRDVRVQEQTCDSSQLRYLSIPPTLTTLPWQFLITMRLYNLCLPSSITAIGNSALGEMDFLRGNLVFPNGLTSIYLPTIKSPFLKKIIAPSSCTIFSVNSLANCFNVELDVPCAITLNNNQTMQNNAKLKKIVIASGKTSIPYNAFTCCANLTDVTIPEGVTIIDQMAFQWCISLRKIVLPSSITEIKQRAFEYAPLDEVILKPTVPPILSNMSVFLTTTYTRIYVPYSADHSILNAYKTATNWTTFANCIFELPAEEN